MLGCVWRVLAIYRTATQQLEAHGRGVDDTQGDDVRHFIQIGTQISENTASESVPPTHSYISS